ncbi:MAG: ribosome maturation factor RimM [Moraxella sp.]|nr:ribosome maturation factor RimM [Moraxella sp.]
MTQRLNTDELIHIATLKKPYGIKGWLWVFSETETHEDIFLMSPWYIKTAMGFRLLTVNQWRKQGQGLVATFQEIPNRNIAETMNGTTIWVHKDNLPSLAADEYYWSDLVGMSVVNAEGENLGVIKNLFETGAHDIMTVAPTKDSVDSEERLIPWHDSTVLAVDRADRVVRVAWQADY